jgi:hypothetical protein
VPSVLRWHRGSAPHSALPERSGHPKLAVSQWEPGCPAAELCPPEGVEAEFESAAPFRARCPGVGASAWLLPAAEAVAWLCPRLPEGVVARSESAAPFRARCPEVAVLA